MPKHRTSEDFLRELRDADSTVADWCRKHGFNQSLAYRVLRGETIGRWGESRRIARAMNLRLPDAPAAKRTAQPAAA